MKLLIIGDNIDIIGGVVNYTRPLFYEFQKSLPNVDTYYLYSSHRGDNPEISIWSSPKIIKAKDKVFKLINSVNLEKNYSSPEIDLASDNDKVVELFLKKLKPDIIHINEIIGFSSNIIPIAKQMGIKVVVTIHEYWWLCVHRVMVDYNNKICEGPTSIEKCTFCVSLRQHENKQQRIRYAVKHDFPMVANLFSKIKKRVFTSSQNIISLDFENISIDTNFDKKLYVKLQNRFTGNIERLNQCDKVIAVSSDVKNILQKFGVEEKNILVQHIGSLIASNKIVHTKEVCKEKISFGFIGGVTYYKGVHQMIEAFLTLPESLILQAELLIYGKYSTPYYNAILKKFGNTLFFHEKVKFIGAYIASELPKITNTIDITILPSLCADTAPQTIFESFNAGLPIIAPRVGGFTDFVVHGVNGLLYEAASVKDLSCQMKSVILEPDLIDSYRKSIPPHIKTMKENCDELSQLFLKLLT